MLMLGGTEDRVKYLGRDNTGLAAPHGSFIHISEALKLHEGTDSFRALLALQYSNILT